MNMDGRDESRVSNHAVESRARVDEMNRPMSSSEGVYCLCSETRGEVNLEARL